MTTDFRDRPAVFGITGGIASGKTLVAQRFAARGVPVVDADRIGHALLEPGSEVFDEVVAAFGPGIVRCGTIDRKALGSIVFSVPGALDRLNAIVHPALRRKVAEACISEARESGGAVAVDAALIAEDGCRDPCFRGLVLVLSSRAERVRRLMENRALSREAAEARVDAQTPPEEKAGLADWVIRNDGSLKELREKADKVVEEALNHA